MENKEFEIKAPKWQLNFMIICVVVALVAVFAIVFAALIADWEWRIVWIWLLLPAFFLGIGLLGIYAWNNEAFRFQKGEFVYVGLMKTKRCDLERVKRVELRGYGNGIQFKVCFLDEKGIELMSFLDDGTAFRSGEFEACLAYYHIPLENRT